MEHCDKCGIEVHQSSLQVRKLPSGKTVFLCNGCDKGNTDEELDEHFLE